LWIRGTESRHIRIRPVTIITIITIITIYCWHRWLIVCNGRLDILPYEWQTDGFRALITNVLDRQVTEKLRFSWVENSTDIFKTYLHAAWVSAVIRNVYNQPLNSLNSTSINTKYLASLALPGSQVTANSLRNGTKIKYGLLSGKFVPVTYWHLQLHYALLTVCRSLRYCVTLITRIRHHKYFNPLTPELNPSAQRCLMRFLTGYFVSWTVHFVNICVKSQQIHQLFIQFINYVW
jgi:hypothetical protein